MFALECSLCGLFSASSGFAGHWIWQSFQVLPTRTARGSHVSARRACLCRACCPAGAGLDMHLPLKRQQWLLMTWKVMCKPSVFSVFRNGTVGCVQKARPALGIWSHAKAHHRRLKGSKGKKMSEWLSWLLKFFSFADCYLKLPVGSWKLDSLVFLCRECPQVLMCCCRIIERMGQLLPWSLLDGLFFLPLCRSCVCKHTAYMLSHVLSGRCMCFEFDHKLWFTFLVSSSLLKASIWHVLEYL